MNLGRRSGFACLRVGSVEVKVGVVAGGSLVDVMLDLDCSRLLVSGVHVRSFGGFLSHVRFRLVDVFGGFVILLLSLLLGVFTVRVFYLSLALLLLGHLVFLLIRVLLLRLLLVVAMLLRFLFMLVLSLRVSFFLLGGAFLFIGMLLAPAYKEINCWH